MIVFVLDCVSTVWTSVNLLKEFTRLELKTGEEL